MPEETLYLLEKGALFCWKASCDDGPGENVIDWDSSSQGAPMSVQQAYAEMIGTEDLTLDRYQVGVRPSLLHCLKPPLYRLSLTSVDLVT